VTGTSGVLSVPYPASFCGVLQADALFGPSQRKMVGIRHQISTCDCPVPFAPAWPSVVNGASSVHAHFAEGIYVSELNNHWTLFVTHPHSAGQVFTGTITTNGALIHLNPMKFEGHDSATQVAPNEIKFRFVNRGYLDGISFEPTCANQITFNASINGLPAPSNQIFLGPSRTPAGSSPLTLTG
jgi:hypothetical protein